MSKEAYVCVESSPRQIDQGNKRPPDCLHEPQDEIGIRLVLNYVVSEGSRATFDLGVKK